ncbi:MAG: hypothetical protein RL318_1728 [Fibrobacterota bacterium]|jgi:phosphatidylserine decarboxylase
MDPIGAAKPGITLGQVLKLLSFLPRVALSHAFGFVSRIENPKWFAKASIRFFLWLFPTIDQSEMVKAATKYPTLNAFFTRTIKSDARTIAPDLLISPCDGTFGQSGPIQAGMALQAKGIGYAIEDFLADRTRAKAYEGGWFITIYLAPYNYHRVHAPATGTLVECVHVAGDLWPVHKKAVAGIPKLFCLNERTWIEQKTASGKVLSCLVGAMNVGHITLSHDRTFGRAAGIQSQAGHGLEIEKAQEIGIFEMGSTVVMLLDKAARESVTGQVPAPGTVARLGQPLFS